MTRLAVLLSTFGYAGLFPFAPGTVGSLAGLVVYAGLGWSGASSSGLAAAIAVVFGAGIWSATAAERHFGATDPGPVVIDEVAGMLITLFLVPASGTGAAAGFVLFRLFDIVKTLPAGRAGG